MQSSTPSDPELLTEWLKHHHESAFRDLVTRYAGLVHMTAKRTCDDEAMATEAAQLTFISLAQKASSLVSCASLGGWLHCTALLHAKNLRRKAQREQIKRERLQSAMENELSSPGNDVWQGLQPALDDALSALSVKDREALLLRYYRSLSVREIAGTLGIAIPAAQKRIDRATERLRGMFLRRGCRVGSSLAGAMAAGFAADAQAAMPAVSLLTSKALATGAVSSGVLSTTTFLSTSAMKTALAAVPLVGLVTVGVWLVGQYRAIGALEARSSAVHQHLIDSTGASASMRSRVSTKTALDNKPVNWAEVANQLRNGNSVGGSSGGFEFLNTNQRLLNRFLSLTREELIADLDDLEAADVSKSDLDLVRDRLESAMTEIDPGTAAKRLSARLKPGEHEDEESGFFRVLVKWTLREPESAVAWLDEQIAAGRIPAASQFIETAVISSLLPYNEDAAVQRMAALPEEKRSILGNHEFGAWWGDKEKEVWKEKDLAAAFARLSRLLPEKAHLAYLSWILTERGESDRNQVIVSIQSSLAGMYDGERSRTEVPISAVKDFFERIKATRAERKACIEAAIHDQDLTLETLRAEYPEALKF